MKGWKKVIQANGHTHTQKGKCSYISDKIDFKLKMVKIDKEGHYIMIKGSIHLEDKTVVNICVPNIGRPKESKS